MRATMNANTLLSPLDHLEPVELGRRIALRPIRGDKTPYISMRQMKDLTHISRWRCRGVI